MLKGKVFENLDNYSISELKKMIEMLQADNKKKQKIIEELEYRLDKLNINVFYDEIHDRNPLSTSSKIVKKVYVPAFEYFELYEGGK